MKKKIACLSVLFLLGTTSSGWALSGFISNDTGTLIGSSAWGDGDGTIDSVSGRDSILSWDVDFGVTNAGTWTYSYTFEVDEKSPSHVIIELSESFTANNIFAGTTPEGEGPEVFTAGGGSNPEMPGDLYGYKWESDDDLLTMSFTMVTDREPMWGDFYAKDGVSEGENVYAYNSMFGQATVAAIDDGNAGGFVLVPDTEGGGGGGAGDPVPEPGTMLLLGTGLLGCGVFLRRKCS